MTAPARVLVADDEPAITELVAFGLGHAGFEVIQANDGQRAVELALAVRPDVILLDVVMPGLDGREVARRLRTDPDFDDTPIALFSSADEVDVDWRGARADAFLQKPFNILRLPAFIRELLELYPRDGTGRRVEIGSGESERVGNE